MSSTTTDHAVLYIDPKNRSCYNHAKYLENTCNLFAKPPKIECTSPKTMMQNFKKEKNLDLLDHVILYFWLSQEGQIAASMLRQDTIRNVHIKSNFVWGSMKAFYELVTTIEKQSPEIRFKDYLLPKLQEICPDLYGKKQPENILINTLFRNMCIPILRKDIQTFYHTYLQTAYGLCHTVLLNVDADSISEILISYEGYKSLLPEKTLLLTASEQQWERFLTQKSLSKDLIIIKQKIADALSPATEYRIKRSIVK